MVLNQANPAPSPEVATILIRFIPEHNLTPLLPPPSTACGPTPHLHRRQEPSLSSPYRWTHHFLYVHPLPPVSSSPSHPRDCLDNSSARNIKVNRLHKRVQGTWGPCREPDGVPQKSLFRSLLGGMVGTTNPRFALSKDAFSKEKCRGAQPLCRESEGVPQKNLLKPFGAGGWEPPTVDPQPSAVMTPIATADSLDNWCSNTTSASYHTGEYREPKWCCRESESVPQKTFKTFRGGTVGTTNRRPATLRAAANQRHG